MIYKSLHMAYKMHPCHSSLSQVLYATEHMFACTWNIKLHNSIYSISHHATALLMMELLPTCNVNDLGYLVPKSTPGYDMALTSIWIRILDLPRNSAKFNTNSAVRALFKTHFLDASLFVSLQQCWHCFIYCLLHLI